MLVAQQASCWPVIMMLESTDVRSTTWSSLVTDVQWTRSETQDTSSKENTTADDQLLLLLLLLLLKTLHNETLSNWTGSLDDPVFDYLNIPLVKVLF